MYVGKLNKLHGCIKYANNANNHCGDTGTVVKERESQEAEMYMKQSASKMKDTMKARREVRIWMKQACLRMKETTMGVDQGID